jgi:hypothetical protein
MKKMDKAQIKQLMTKAYEEESQERSLSKAFEDFAEQTGRAKGSIRNVYYATLQEANENDDYKKEMLCGNNIEVSKIIGFKDAESDLLLRKILTGATFGKSVRRVISEMTDSPKLALRYQNKYRNLLKYEKDRVLKIRQQIIEDYGKCYEPYKDNGEGDKSLERLKKEINGLYDKIAFSVKEENKKLRQRIKILEEENIRLVALVNAENKNTAKDYFKEELAIKKGG